MVVVGVSPSLDDRPGLGHRGELFAGEALVSKAAVETLQVAVPPRATWLDVGSPDVDVPEELTHSPRDELRPIFTANELGDAPGRYRVSEQLNELIACEPSPDLQGKAPSGVCIDDNKCFRETSIGCSVEDEFDRPDMVLVLGLASYDASQRRTQSPTFMLLLWYFQALLTPESIDSLLTDLFLQHGNFGL